MLRHVLLGLLCDRSPQHGYALAKALRERVGIDVNTGSVYRELRQLAKAGLVRGVAGRGREDPGRMLYGVTPTGRRAFDGWLAEPLRAASTAAEDDLGWRASFLDGLGEQVVGAALRRWREELWLGGKALEQARDAYGGAGSGSDGLEVIRLLLERRSRHVAVDLEFLDDLRATYERRRTGRLAERAKLLVPPRRQSRGRGVAAGQGEQVERAAGPRALAGEPAPEARELVAMPRPALPHPAARRSAATRG